MTNLIISQNPVLRLLLCSLLLWSFDSKLIATTTAFAPLSKGYVSFPNTRVVLLQSRTNGKGNNTSSDIREENNYYNKNNEVLNGSPINGKTNSRRQRYADFPSKYFTKDSLASNAYSKYRQKPSSSADDDDNTVIRFPSINGKERVFRTSDIASKSSKSAAKNKTATGSTDDEDKDEDTVSKAVLKASESPLVEKLMTFLFGPSKPLITEMTNQKRLLKERTYAKPDAFKERNIYMPPTLDDLMAVSKPKPLEGGWISTPARLLSFLVAYISFPFIIKFMDMFVTTTPGEDLNEIAGRFGPGVSVLYGTFVSLTLSILYNRQQSLQGNAGTECSLLVLLIRNLLNLFKNDRDRAIDACQCAADQIRTMVQSSRGAELMLVMYSDPYSRIHEIVDSYEQECYDNEDKKDEVPRMTSLTAYTRDTLKDLQRVRALRLSDESNALPPTHFLMLNILTCLILLGYVTQVISITEPKESPSFESTFFFGVLTSVYVLFYNFCNDLNNPFQGIYQVQRSSAAAHLLEAKWLLANHPVLQGQVDFEEAGEESSGVRIKTPGLGNLWFEPDEIMSNKNEQDDND